MRVVVCCRCSGVRCSRVACDCCVSCCLAIFVMLRCRGDLCANMLQLMLRALCFLSLLCVDMVCGVCLLCVFTRLSVCGARADLLCATQCCSFAVVFGCGCS